MLRLATYNIRHGVGTDGRLDLARTAASVAALDADVVGLQEVDDGYGARSGFEDQASRLAALLERHVLFEAVIDRDPVASGQRRRRYGLALLSRTEIIDRRLHLLPADPGRPAPREPRGLLTARVAAAEALHILLTHLDNRDRRHRAAQVRGILQHAEALGGPAVLLGDLNADPSAPELTQLTASGWRDAAWEAAGRSGHSPLRSTFTAALPWVPRAPRATHPAHLPRRRIDSIWVRGDIEVTGMETRRSLASDHRPVVATIRRRRP